MAKNDSDNSETSGPKVSPLGAAVAGAVAGAIAGATVVVLSDPKKREQIKQRTRDLMEKGKRGMDDMGESMDGLKTQGKKVLADQLDRAKNKLEAGDEKSKKEEAGEGGRE